MYIRHVLYVSYYDNFICFNTVDLMTGLLDSDQSK